jgi:hypothetical protein
MRPCRSHQAAHARLPLPRLFRARVPYVASSSSCSPLSSALLGLADMLSDFLVLATGDAPVSLRSKKKSTFWFPAKFRFERSVLLNSR